MAVFFVHPRGVLGLFSEHLFEEIDWVKGGTAIDSGDLERFRIHDVSVNFYALGSRHVGAQPDCLHVVLVKHLLRSVVFTKNGRTSSHLDDKLMVFVGDEKVYPGFGGPVGAGEDHVLLDRVAEEVGGARNGLFDS